MCGNGGDGVKSATLRCKEVENGSAVHGGPQQVAFGCTCSSDGNTGGGEWLQRRGGEQCGGICILIY